MDSRTVGEGIAILLVRRGPPMSYRLASSVLLVAALALGGCAGIQVQLEEEDVEFGAKLSPEGVRVGVVLFDDERAEPGDMGSMTTYLPPPVNTYRTAWIWGTLAFYTDEPLAREFTNAVAQGLAQIGCHVFRSPAPDAWTANDVRELARRTGAQCVVHGDVEAFRMLSEWTAADPADMVIEMTVRVYGPDGAVRFDRRIKEEGTKHLPPGEFGPLAAQELASQTFRGCIEALFHDPAFRRAFEEVP